SAIMATVYYLQIDVFLVEPIAFITQITLIFILLWLVLNIPLFFSLLVGLTGYVIFGIIQVLLMVCLTFLGITSHDQIHSELLHLVGFQIFDSSVFLLLVFFLQSRKIGFMFVMNRTAIAEKSKKINLY